MLLLQSAQHSDIVTMKAFFSLLESEVRLTPRHPSFNVQAEHMNDTRVQVEFRCLGNVHQMSQAPLDHEG